jgi:putative endonuclease
LSFNEDKRSSTQKLGAEGEQYVATYLQDLGFTIIEYNYRTPQGEIDLIATQRDLVTFVEVKLRIKPYFDMSQVLTRRKQKNIIKAAHQFLVSTSYLSTALCRFDVALLEGSPYQLTYIPDAFRQ